MKDLPHILVLLLVCGQIQARIPSATRWAVRRSQKQALTTVPELAARNGGSVNRAVREGGLEALSRDPEALARVAAELTPRARRALLQNTDRLLPLALSRGPEAVELAVRYPGVHRKLMRMGGSVRQLSDVPPADLPRLLRYLDAADSPATREALLGAYAREGPRLFERIPPRLVLAGGLSTALVLGTHRATAPFHGAGEALAQADARDLLDRVQGRSYPIHLLIAGAALLLPLLIIPLLHHPFKRREPNEKESVPAVPDAVHPAVRGM